MAKIKVTPFADKVLVRKIEEAQKTGLVLQDSVKERPQQGIIVACGPDTMALHEGDRVLFGKYAGSDVDVNGEKLLLMTANELLGLVEVLKEDEPEKPAKKGKVRK